MNELRSVVTIVSFLTFIGIIWWAWRPGSKQQADIAMSDALLDDDLHSHSTGQGTES